MKLHPLMRKSRYGKALRFVKDGSILMDVGCGVEFNFLRMIKDRISFAYGIDKCVDEDRNRNIELVNYDFDREDAVVFPLPDGVLVNQVFFLAVIEHVNNPEAVLTGIYDCMSDGGELILTTPTRSSKPVLELCSYRLKLIDEAYIRDHKQYFSKKDLIKMVENAGFTVKSHSYLGIFFNQLVVAEKRAPAALKN